MTEAQIELAYEIGEKAAESSARTLEAENKASATGKTVRKSGKVSGEGVTGNDLQKAFGMNPAQVRAYNVLATVAAYSQMKMVLL